MLAQVLSDFCSPRLMKNAHKSTVKIPVEILAPVGVCTLKEATAETQEDEKMFYGLPPGVRKMYEAKGITQLYGEQKATVKEAFL